MSLTQALIARRPSLARRSRSFGEAHPRRSPKSNARPESGFRYTPTTTFETFPFPRPSDEQRDAIAAAARRLDELRAGWLDPPGASESELKARTLTNPYNERPAWLRDIHARLDNAVLAAYGSPADIATDDLLANPPRPQPGPLPRMGRDLFVYIDEPGKFDFSPKGTAWFYLTALSTMDPAFGLTPWHDIKYGAIRQGRLIQELKASEDRQSIRDQVFDLLASGVGSLRVDAIAIEKAKLHPGLQVQHAFYDRLLAALVGNIVRDQHISLDRLFVFLDTIPVNLKRRAVVGGLKRAIGRSRSRGRISPLERATYRTQHGPG